MEWIIIETNKERKKVEMKNARKMVNLESSFLAPNFRQITKQKSSDEKCGQNDCFRILIFSAKNTFMKTKSES